MWKRKSACSRLSDPTTDDPHRIALTIGDVVRVTWKHPQSEGAFWAHVEVRQRPDDHRKQQQVFENFLYDYVRNIQTTTQQAVGNNSELPTLKDLQHKLKELANQLRALVPYPAWTASPTSRCKPCRPMWQKVSPASAAPAPATT